MSKAALVIGGSIEGVQAAIDLAESQIEVYLVESSPALREMSESAPPNASVSTSHNKKSSNVRTASKTTGIDTANLPRIIPKLLAAMKHPNIRVLTNAEVVRVDGSKGDFQVEILRRPRYVSEEKCSGCARCEEACPVETRVTNGTKRGKKAIGSPGLRSIPLTYAITKLGKSPCREACPGGVNGQGYLALISKGKFGEALDLIREAVPFPGVLGRVCTRPCESACSRGEIDEPLAICWLKRFVADQEMFGGENRRASSIGSSPAKGKTSVAIVGSGPAGLTAARDLAALGYRVTVFEAAPEAGGMLRSCIPPFRLPRNVLDAEIDYVKSFGVEIRTSSPIGQTLSIADLREQGYKAILIAPGTHKARKLNVPGDSLAGVVDCIDLLKDVHLGKKVTAKGRIVVLGGGNAAIDAARTAARLGADEVRILYRRTRADMQANHSEVEEAEKEGVIIDELVAPARILGEQRVSGIECVRMVADGIGPDGRASVAPVKGSEFRVDADLVITAIGQYADLDFLPTDYREQFGPGATIPADDQTLATKIPGTFAAGDAVSGPSTVIEAIAAGKRAAQSINRYIEGGYDWQEFLGEGGKARSRQDIKPTLPPIDATTIGVQARVQMPALGAAERKITFDEVEMGLSAEAAMREAQRCLNCGGCSECMECVRACELNAIAHDDSAEQLTINAGAILVASKASSISGDGVYHIEAVSQTPKAGLISSSVAASRALAVLSTSRPQHEASAPGWEMAHASIHIGEASKAHGGAIGVFLCQCGGQISSVIDFATLKKFATSLANISHVDIVPYACSGAFNEHIKDTIAHRRLGGAVIAACPCCASDQICAACSHSRIRCKETFTKDGAEGPVLEFVNIREQCAWVHHDRPAEATEKAMRLVHAGALRLLGTSPSSGRFQSVRAAAVVVGADKAGVRSALSLASLGYPVTLLSSTRLGSSVRDQLESRGVIAIDDIEKIGIGGTVGEFQIDVVRDGERKTIAAGAIIADGQAVSGDTKDREVTLFGRAVRPEMLSAKAGGDIDAPETVVRGVYFCEPGLESTDAEDWGAEAAMKAAVMLARKRIWISPEVARVEEARCRGCGDCEKICSYYAIRLADRAGLPAMAVVDEALCRGCGNCAAHCNSGAISILGVTQTPTKAILAGLLGD